MSETGKKKITATILTAATAAYAVLFAAATAAVLWQGLAVRVYTIQTNKLKSPVRIALLTDLHGSFYGSGQKNLIKALRRQNPDLVVLSGDTFDEYTTDDRAKRLLSALSAFYPCFYVTGNHENWRRDTAAVKEWVRKCGITVLEGTGQTVTINGQGIDVFGVDDPEAFLGSSYSQNRVGSGWYRQFEACRAALENGRFSILLSHRPEQVASYSGSGFDLVLAGHAHGGQVRVPGIVNGLYAPNQGLFPPFAGGLYELENTDLVVSRGLCKNVVPRVFNPPELVMVDVVPVMR